MGRVLAAHLHSQGHDVTILSRSGAVAPWRVVSWDGLTIDDWSSALEHADVLVNLAGRSVNCRYNARNRRAIFESRIRTTRLLGEAIGRLAHPPRLWLNASTATIYRHALDRAMDEATGEIGGREPNAPSTWRFSIDVATRWEESFFSANSPGVRKVALRSAIVMSAERGGPFDMLLLLVRLGLGGKSGSGKQFVSWVHELDFVRAIDYLIANEEIEGTVNVASPGPLPNSDFIRILRQTWGTPIGLPVPEWVLELGAILLRTETELILKSRRVIPSRLLESGFKFQFTEWSRAAQDLVERYRLQSARKSGGSRELARMAADRNAHLKLWHRGEAK